MCVSVRGINLGVFLVTYSSPRINDRYKNNIVSGVFFSVLLMVDENSSLAALRLQRKSVKQNTLLHVVNKHGQWEADGGNCGK